MNLSKRIFKSFLIVLTITPLLMSCLSPAQQGNGRIHSRVIDVEDYNEILVDASINVVYEALPGIAPHLRIEGDENLIYLVEATIKNGKLHIKQSKNTNNTAMTIFTNSSSLKSIVSKGSSSIELLGAIAGDELDVKMQGKGSFLGDNLVFKKASFTMAGAGDIKLGGKISKAKYLLTGKGSFMASDLDVNDLDCSLKGVGDMEVKANSKLKVSINGDGLVKYSGKAQNIKQEIKGKGSIVRMDS